MGQSSSTTPEKAESPAAPAGGEKKKLKPCCACPETRKARDEWYVTW
jgi:pyruvate/2-oxoacid:ferredoxin oxidoreductase beta subunit